MIMKDRPFRKSRSTAEFLASFALCAAVALASMSCSGRAEESGEAAAGEAPGPAAQAPAAAAEAPAGDRTSAVFTDIELSPAAKMQAEKFDCICGCNLRLSKCFCEKTPGSIDMKQHLQKLVDSGLSPKEIEEGMIAKYGEAVIP